MQEIFIKFMYLSKIIFKQLKINTLALWKEPNKKKKKLLDV
jgi:hypothetical protein